MGKRLGRKRLFSLNKLGQTSTQTAGTGISPAIATQTETRDGSLITTDIQIDLGTSAGAIASVTTAGSNAAGNAVIGVAALTSSLVTVAEAQGVLASAELICVEPPATGEDNIGVWYGDTVLSSSMTMDQASANGVELIAAEVYAAAGDSAANTDISADIDGKYIYLVSSGSTGNTYSAGKFILRLYGYGVFNDV
jgi:hypothetical protein